MPQLGVPLRFQENSNFDDEDSGFDSGDRFVLQRGSPTPTSLAIGARIFLETFVATFVFPNLSSARCPPHFA